TPVFESVEIDTPQGTLTIDAPRNSADEKYISSMTLGGGPLKSYRISHDQLMEGKNLNFKLSNSHK
ncbi:MAG: glycoside hydrolase family 92 protein, partial [Paramuribaculum sp.]|nr:glycoside hydrolase family 92 protein [Paramuribaculum sp.]